MSFGVIALSAVIIFCAQFFRPRWVLLVGAIVSGYLGLTGYANYMRDRNELRASIWGGNRTPKESHGPAKRLKKVSGLTGAIQITWRLSIPD